MIMCLIVNAQIMKYHYQQFSVLFRLLQANTLNHNAQNHWFWIYICHKLITDIYYQMDYIYITNYNTQILHFTPLNFINTYICGCLCSFSAYKQMHIY